MRIQETDKVLKEARFARRAAAEPEHGGFMKSPMWIGVAVVAAAAVAGLVGYLLRQQRD